MKAIILLCVAVAAVTAQTGTTRPFFAVSLLSLLTLACGGHCCMCMTVSVSEKRAMDIAMKQSVANPNLNPSLNPSLNPNLAPTINPSLNPNLNPTINPSTINPSLNPSFNPNVVKPALHTLNPAVNPGMT
jgi:hypothetical protein